MKTITVVGASLAGFCAVRELRAQGFDGRAVVVGAEGHLPYDRPPLSKDFLTGSACRTDIALADENDHAELAVEWVLGRAATRVHPGRRAVELADGTDIVTDGVVIATGAAARTLPDTDGLLGVHVLRTVDDAEALRAALTSGRPRVVVIGAGFIGAEIASSCTTLGLDVTLVEAAALPLVEALGERMARVCTELHVDHGVRVRCGVAVDGLSTRDGQVTGVRLADGQRLPADIVVVGIGVRPNTEWLAESGVAVADGVLCDSGCATANPVIVAAGDVARVHRPQLGKALRAEHWTSATQQPAVAVRNLLAGRTVAQFDNLPYFWSDQYGVRIQFTGDVLPGDEVDIVDGSVEDRRFLGEYRREGRPVGMIAFNSPRHFARARRTLGPPRLRATF